MSIVITQDDLLGALAAASAAPAEARTINELGALTGWPAKRVREAIGRLAVQNRISVHRVTRRGIDGRIVHSPAYTILPPPKASRK